MPHKSDIKVKNPPVGRMALSAAYRALLENEILSDADVLVDAIGDVPRSSRAFNDCLEALARSVQALRKATGNPTQAREPMTDAHFAKTEADPTRICPARLL